MTDRHLWKHYLPATVFSCVCLSVQRGSLFRALVPSPICTGILVQPSPWLHLGPHCTDPQTYSNLFTLKLGQLDKGQLVFKWNTFLFRMFWYLSVDLILIQSSLKIRYFFYIVKAYCLASSVNIFFLIMSKIFWVPYQSGDLSSFSPYIFVAHTPLLIVLREVDNSFNHGSQNYTALMHCILFGKQRWGSVFPIFNIKKSCKKNILIENIVMTELLIAIGYLVFSY